MRDLKRPPRTGATWNAFAPFANSIFHAQVGRDHTGNQSSPYKIAPICERHLPSNDIFHAQIEWDHKEIQKLQLELKEERGPKEQQVECKSASTGMYCCLSPQPPGYWEASVLRAGILSDDEEHACTDCGWQEIGKAWNAKYARQEARVVAWESGADGWSGVAYGVLRVHVFIQRSKVATKAAEVRLGGVVERMWPSTVS